MKPFPTVLANIKINVVYPVHPLAFQISAQHTAIIKWVVNSPIFKHFKVFLFAFLFASSCISQELTHGTTIIVVRTKDRIIIGADSRETQTRSQPRTLFQLPNPIQGRIIEKIKISDNIAFVLAGTYTQNNTLGQRIFDAYQIAATACAGQANIFYKAGSFQLAVKQPLEGAWEQILYSNRQADLNEYPLAFIACGFYDNTPFVIVQIYQAKANPAFWGISSPPWSLQSRFVPEAVIDQRRFPLLNKIDSTYTDIISSAIDNNSLKPLTKLLSTDPVEYVRRGVQMAIDADPTRNGPPIKILSITNDGMQWIQ